MDDEKEGKNGIKKLKEKYIQDTIIINNNDNVKRVMNFLLSREIEKEMK